MSAIRPVTRIVVADARTHPRRTLLVAGLLTLTAVAPWLAPALTVPLLVAAGAVAVAIAALALESNQSNLTVLDLNGVGRGSRSALAVGAALVPGVIAIVPAVAAALAVALGGNDSISVAGVVTGVVWITLVLPALTAGILSIATATSPTGRRGWRKAARIAVVVILLPLFPIGTAIAFGLIWLWRRDRPPTGWGLALALATIVVVALLLGGQSSWANANILSFILLPALAVAVARLATGVMAGLSSRVAARRPTGRLAAAQLLLRRRAYAPLVATAALVLTAVTMQAVLGAGLGEREAQRQDGLARFDHRAGLSDHQLIVQTALDRRGIEQLTRAAQDEWGSGSVAAIEPYGLEEPLFDLFGAVPDGGPLAATRGSMRGPRGIGVVKPEELNGLGLGAHRADLRAGRALILNPALGSENEVAIADREGSATAEATRMPAVRVSSQRIAHELPGMLVSPAIISAATEKDGGALFDLPAWSDEGVRPVTFVVALDHEPTPADRATASRLAEPMTARVKREPALTDRGRTSTTLSPTETAVLLFSYGGDAPVVASGGTAVVDDWPDGPLNDTAFAGARSWQASRGSLALGAVLALVLVVIVAVLANGLARDEDEVIELQGGAPDTRRRISAIQAGLLGVAASSVAALVGIGAVGLGIATYNGSSRWADLGFQDPRPLPPIPFSVPWPVVVVLVVVPVLAAAVSAAVTAMAPRPDARSLSSRLA